MLSSVKGLVTVTVTVSVFVSSVDVVTVIVAVPIATAVTSPFATVAISVLSLAQVTSLFVAVVGVTVAIKVLSAPTNKESSSLSRVTPVAATVNLVTVTVTVSVFVLSVDVVTVIVAVPTATAVTSPFATVAILGLSLSYLTSLFVAVVGVTVAIKVLSAPTFKESPSLSRFTPVTAMIDSVTVTVTVSVFVLSADDVTVIVAVPTATAVTSPFATVAILGLSLSYLTSLFVAVVGVTVAIKVLSAPTFKESPSLSRFTPVTAMIDSVTVTVTVSVFVLSADDVTVIVAVPTATAVTSPFATVTILGLLLAQLTSLLVAVVGVTVAIKVLSAPTNKESSSLSRVTPVAATVNLVTVTVTVSVFVLSVDVVTVIVAVPTATAVTSPFATVAILGLSLSYLTSLFVAVVGVTVAIKVLSAPTIKESPSLSRVTPVAATLLSSSELHEKKINKNEIKKIYVFFIMFWFEFIIFMI